jgi:hypothetical protein
MNGRPAMPVPKEELSPGELAARIKQWAEGQEYEYQLLPHASEFGKVLVRDPNGGYTSTVIPNAHHGRRLRKDQVRYVVQRLNSNWKE